MRKIIFAGLLTAVACGGAASSHGNAADLKVLITNGAKPILSELGPQFERSTGHKLSLKSDGSALLQKAIEQGEGFDVTLLTASSMDAIAKAGKIDVTTRKDIASSGLGVSVRAGAPKPDISTVDAFKNTLLKAASVAYVTTGASGLHFIAVAERLGIGDQIKAKGKTLPAGNVAEFVAKGEAELAIQQVSELGSVAGVELLGPFPAELQLNTLFVGAISATSKNPEAARAFLNSFSTPEGIKIIRTKGMEPS